MTSQDMFDSDTTGLETLECEVVLTLQWIITTIDDGMSGRELTNAQESSTDCGPLVTVGPWNAFSGSCMVRLELTNHDEALDFPDSSISRRLERLTGRNQDRLQYRNALSNTETDSDSSDADSDERFSGVESSEASVCKKRSYDRERMTVAYAMPSEVEDGEHKCPFCSSCFGSTRDLRWHLSKDHSQQVFWTEGSSDDYSSSSASIDPRVTLVTVIHQCCRCERVFDTYALLRKHIEIDHSVEVKPVSRYPLNHIIGVRQNQTHVPCHYCLVAGGHSQSDKDLVPYMESDLGKPLKCESCCITFLYPANVNFHRLKAHGELPSARTRASTTGKQSNLEKDQSHTCSECGKSCNSSEDLKLHLTKLHPPATWCEFCRQLFQSARRLEGHQDRCHPDGLLIRHPLFTRLKHVCKFQCSLCSASYGNTARLRDHMRFTHLEVPYQCDLCSKIFDNGASLWSHQECHKGSFRCAKCTSILPNYVLIISHLRDEHRNIYPCGFCKDTFRAKYELKRHCSSKHRGRKVVFCERCPDKGFASEKAYKDHKLTHTGVKKFPCPICGKLFLTLQRVRNHKRVHSDVKPCLCDTCGKTFRGNSFLNAHHRKHHSDPENPKPAPELMACEYCGKLFNKQQMKYHIASHEAPKLKCDVCEKLFRTHSNLWQHQLCHSDNRPHSCPTCGETFKLPSHLRNHQRRHTGEPNPYPHKKNKKM